VRKRKNSDDPVKFLKRTRSIFSFNLHAFEGEEVLLKIAKEIYDSKKTTEVNVNSQFYRALF
jgi:hypothetical protein